MTQESLRNSITRSFVNLSNSFKMGHLSTSERIDTSKVISDDSKLSKMMFSDNNNNVKDNHDSSNDLKNGPDCNNNDVKNNNVEVKVAEENNNNNNCIKYSNKCELNSSENFINGPNILGVQFMAPLKWDKIIMIGVFHMIFLYALFSYSLLTNVTLTTLWALFMGGCAGFGVTGGVHRLWSHKAYKAKLPLRIILMICYSIAGQNTIYDWVRDHRVHHKFSETDADPHNSNRGFFFAHVGWLMMHKHPEVLRRGRQIDMDDILSDPVVRFHQKYFIPMKMIFCFLLPTIIPAYFWNECWYWSIMTQVVLRYVFSLNFTWSVNSAAHMWGKRPYDKKINPSENIGVSIVAMGEGWHNYHHVFPWDYKAAELGTYKFNITTFWIDLFAKIGWAYDLKQPSKELIERTILKCGDGSHPSFGHHLSEVALPNDELDENANIADIKKE